MPQFIKLNVLNRVAKWTDDQSSKVFHDTLVPHHTLFKCPSPFPSPLKIIHQQSYPHWPLKNSILTQWFPFPLRQYKECTSKDDKWLIPSFLSINLNFLIPWRYDYVTLTRRDWVTIIFLTPATVPTMATKMKLPQVSCLRGFFKTIQRTHPISTRY